MKRNSVLLILLLIIKSSVFAQLPSQTIRGSVIDKASHETLIGAAVRLLDSTEFKGTACDLNGNFRLEHVPLGRQMLKVSMIGYKEVTLFTVVTSGKEVVLTIELEQSVIEGKEITIVSEREKTRPIMKWQLLVPGLLL